MVSIDGYGSLRVNFKGSKCDVKLGNWKFIRRFNDGVLRLIVVVIMCGIDAYVKQTC